MKIHLGISINLTVFSCAEPTIYSLSRVSSHHYHPRYPSIDFFIAEDQIFTLWKDDIKGGTLRLDHIYSYTFGGLQIDTDTFHIAESEYSKRAWYISVPMKIAYWFRWRISYKALYILREMNDDFQTFKRRLFKKKKNKKFRHNLITKIINRKDDLEF